MSVMPAMEGVANVALGGLTSLLFQRRHHRRSASAERVRQIEAAAEALDRHAVGLHELLYSSPLSNPLKLLLIDISDALEERASAARFVQVLAAVPRPHGSADRLNQDFADLCAADAALAGVFRAAVMDGVAAALLRWPDPAVQAAKILADAAALTPGDLAAIVPRCLIEAPSSDLETEPA
jgi:hypothetical protein